MATVQVSELGKFVAPGIRPSGFDFCLPQFEGTISAPCRLRGNHNREFGYPSFAVAERDMRSAMHVFAVLSRRISADKIAFQGPDDFLQADRMQRVGIVFGSRSNRALPWLEDGGRLSRLVNFTFGEEWSIIGSDDKHFSMKDPSTIGREEYAAMIDYGVIARVLGPGNAPVFLLAGLGGRATEGCGIYFAQNWRRLHKRFSKKDFAVILEFPPPVDPERCREIAQYE